MVLAEAVKFDTGDLVLLLIALLAWAVGGATFLGGVGMGVGIGIARLRQTKEEVAALDRGNLLGLWVLAAVLAAVSLVLVRSALSGARLGGGTSVLAALPAPAVWGWWNARVRRYSGPRYPMGPRPLGGPR